MRFDLRKRLLRRYGMIAVSALLMLAGGLVRAQYQDFGDINELIRTVHSMLQGGQPRADIAAFVTRVVSGRIVSLNRSYPGRDMLDNYTLQTMRSRFQAWSDAGTNVDDPYAAADWAWKNRMGHCAENAHSAFHVLAMALQSTDELCEVKCGDHQYVLWGNVSRLKQDISLSDLQQMENTYVVDPWGDFCVSTKDLAWYNYYQTKFGATSISQLVKFSFEKYDRMFRQWVAECQRNPEAYRAWLASLPSAKPPVSAPIRITLELNPKALSDRSKTGLKEWFNAPSAVLQLTPDPAKSNEGVAVISPASFEHLWHWDYNVDDWQEVKTVIKVQPGRFSDLIQGQGGRASGRMQVQIFKRGKFNPAWQLFLNAPDEWWHALRTWNTPEWKLSMAGEWIKEWVGRQ
jgi:hypothetical protein